MATPEQIRSQQKADAEKRHAEIKANLPALTEPTANLPAFSPANDGLEETAKENDGRLIQGQRLNFSEGSWTIGKEATAFDTKRQLTALGILTAWVKWEDKKPSRIIIKQPGQPFPERDELDCQDQAQWPNGPSGDPADPWRRTMHVYFADEKTSAGFTYAASSWGAKSSISDLATTIRNHRFKEPGALPIVTLASAPHKTKFGTKKKPAFEVVGWTSSNGSAEPSPATTTPSAPPASNVVELTAAKADDGKPYDDAIPF